jgi:hypothetical protein
MVVGLGSESTNWEHFVIVSSSKEGRCELLLYVLILKKAA